MKRILILLLSLVLLACVPTPEQDTVISKTEEALVPVEPYHADSVPNAYHNMITENGVAVVPSTKR